MSAMSFLLANEWNKSDCKLDVGDEITVDGEFYICGQQRPKISLDSYWAVVTAHIIGDLYKAEDAYGIIFELERKRLWLQKRHPVCCAHVSQMIRNTITLLCSISQPPS